jgi:hypothetical protein
LLTLSTGGVTIALKGLGALTGLAPGDRHRSIERAALIAPVLFSAVLTALIAVQVFSLGMRVTIDARAAGLVAAILGVRARVPPVLILLSAAAATAAVRFVTSNP